MDRRSWFAIVATTILLCSPVALFNYIVDNHSLLRNAEDSAELRDYVRAMRGAEFGVQYKYNDRSVKLVVARESTADCLAIGSSHIMTLRQFNNPLVAQTCRSLDNVGVTGASFEDVMVFLAAGLSNPKVKTLIVGVDLWTLRRNTRLNWMRNSQEMFAARKLFGLSSDAYSEAWAMASSSWIEQLFSFKYLQANQKFMKRVWAGKTDSEYDSRPLSAEDLHKELALRSDASLSYPTEFAPTPANENLATTDQWIEPPYYDQTVRDELKQALSIIQQHGKNIILFMGSYHPYVVNDCPKPQICEAIKIMTPVVQGLATNLHAPLLGNYLPEPLGLVGDDFIDFQHIRGNRWDKISFANY